MGAEVMKWRSSAVSVTAGGPRSRGAVALVVASRSSRHSARGCRTRIGHTGQLRAIAGPPEPRSISEDSDLLTTTFRLCPSGTECQAAVRRGEARDRERRNAERLVEHETREADGRVDDRAEGETRGASSGITALGEKGGETERP
jgi:hypothetical protein